MYYYIKGTLAAKGDNCLVVDAGGVGYRIYTSLNCIEKAGSTGSEITVYTYLNVREDAMELYGFISEDERKMFMLLISVSGVGPKAAKRIILELKDKIDNDVLGIDAEGVILSPAEEVIADSRAEAMSALVALGYSSQEAKQVLVKLDASLSTEELIKKALTQLM